MSPLRALLIGALAATLAFAPTPVHAETVTGKDAADDVTGINYVDLRSVQVKHTKKAVTVRLVTKESESHQGVRRTYLDIDERRRGPELLIESDSYHWEVQPIRGWKVDRRKASQNAWDSGEYDGKAGRCGKLVTRTGKRRGDLKVESFVVKKRARCFSGKRVRVHRTATTTGYLMGSGYDDTAWPSSVTDRLPGKSRKFTPWVVQKSAKKKARTFKDGRDPVRAWTDILAVEADHGPTVLAVSVTHRARPSFRSGGVTAYVDTNSDGRPNYYVAPSDSGGRVYVSKVSSWDDYGTPVDCVPGSDLASVGESVSEFTVPTSCLGSPASLRIAVVNQDVGFGAYRPFDWWGGSRRWSTDLSRS